MELNFLRDMIVYMQEGNEVSPEGDKRIKEVIDRVSSRPVVTAVLDMAAIEETMSESNEEVESMKETYSNKHLKEEQIND